MSIMTSRPALRWLVPAGAALAVLGGGVAIGALTAATDPSLPPRSAAELLVDLQTARLDGMSGTIVYTADLGLPALPGLGGGPGGGGGGLGSPDLASLVAGTHTLRVWYSGPDQARIALLGTLGETDIITNGRELWVWHSRANQATHRTISSPGQTASPRPESSPGGMTPRQLADLALAAINPSTEVTTDGSAMVAGRSAYELVLAPRDHNSLVSSVRLAIDAEEHVPLRVQVFGRGADDPALEAAFTQVSFERPDPSQFTFKPPPGAQITEETAPDPAQAPPGRPAEATDPAARPAFATVGSGWTTVFVLRPPEPAVDGGEESGEGARDFDLDALRERLPQSVAPGGGGATVLTSRLFTVLFTPDGRILFGAVTADRLVQAAADPAAQLPS